MFMAKQDMKPLTERRILERVLPGETMPYGECPKCRAVVHPAKIEESVMSLALRIARILSADCASRSMDDSGDRAVTALILAGALERA